MQARKFMYEHRHVIPPLTQANLHWRLPGPLFITNVFGIIRTHCAAETCDYLQKATHDSLSSHYVENKKAKSILRRGCHSADSKYIASGALEAAIDIIRYR